jgi:predicted DNA-binding transcriptional regulator AlpA
MSDPRQEPVTRDLLTKKEVARKVGLSVRTIERYVALNKFPPPVRFSRSCVRWRRRDIDDYLERLPVARKGASVPTAPVRAARRKSG